MDCSLRHPLGASKRRGAEVNMLAYDPKYRTKKIPKDFGDTKYLTDEEIDEVVEYVPGDQRPAGERCQGRTRDLLFHDNTKGNCFDCHDMGGTRHRYLRVDQSDQERFVLYGSDRASILESIVKGRHGSCRRSTTCSSPRKSRPCRFFVFSRAGTKRSEGDEAICIWQACLDRSRGQRRPLGAGALGIDSVAFGQDQSAAAPKDVIFARKILMGSIGDNMDELDTMVRGPTASMSPTAPRMPTRSR